MGIDEMLVLNEKLGKDGRLFLTYNKSTILQLYLQSGINDFIDKEIASCNFLNKKFIDLLEFVKSIPDIPQSKIVDYDISGISGVRINIDYPSLLKEDKSYFYEALIRSPGSYLFIKHCFNGDDFTIKGYPADSGNGTLITARNYIGITEKSTCKEGAWEFIKYYLSDRIQCSGKLTLEGLPIKISAFKKLFETAKDDYYYIAYQNIYTIVKSSYPYSETLQKQNGFELYQITDEDIEFLVNFLNTIEVRQPYDQTAYDIIMEEVNAFFAGAITAEKCAGYIQNRVQLYLHEQK